MKQIFYQKLLLSLVLLAFFGTLASAQVMSRSDVDVQRIEAKKLLGVTKHTSAKRTDTEVTKIRTEKEKQAQPNSQRNEAIKQARGERMAPQKINAQIVKKAMLKPNLERKLIKNRKQSLREKAEQITPPLGFKVVVTEVGGKEYIEFVKTAEGTGMNPVRTKN